MSLSRAHGTITVGSNGSTEMARATGRSKTRDPAIIRRPLDHCPECASRELEPVVDLHVEEVHFLCAACDRCWHVELGYVRRVQPIACHGCPQSERCAASYLRDHASD
jgi:hypothetical protein